jgi:hypothetical protein
MSGRKKISDTDTRISTRMTQIKSTKLELTNLQLGIIHNFRNIYLKSKRIINPKFYPRHPGEKSASSVSHSP